MVIEVPDLGRGMNPTAAGFAGGSTAVPEPGTIVLLGLGALGALRRRRAR